MNRGVVPNAEGAWAKALRGRGSVELMELQAGIDSLSGTPAFQEIRKLVIKAHDELVEVMVSGPSRGEGEYAKLAGAIEGLEGLEKLLKQIRSAAERGEKELRDEVESSRPRLEAV